MPSPPRPGPTGPIHRLADRLAGTVLSEDVGRARRASCLVLLAVFGTAGVVASAVIRPADFTDPVSLLGLGLFGVVVALAATAGTGPEERRWTWFVALTAVTEVPGVIQLSDAAYVLLPQACLGVYWAALYLPTRLVRLSTVLMGGTMALMVPAMGWTVAAVLSVSVSLGAAVIGAFLIHVVVLAVRRANGELDAARSLAERLATTDPLTGAANRRRFAEHALAVAGVGGGLLLVDVDRFKHINDTYGHPVGDEVLCGLHARLVRATGGALVARWGGEEFAVLTPVPGSDAALRRLAETIREAVAGTALPTRAGVLRVTVSVGGLCWRPGTTVEEALRLADGALYRAKAAGRDRVALAADDTVVAPAPARALRTPVRT